MYTMVFMAMRTRAYIISFCIAYRVPRLFYIINIFIHKQLVAEAISRCYLKVRNDRNLITIN